MSTSWHVTWQEAITPGSNGWIPPETIRVVLSTYFGVKTVLSTSHLTGVDSRMCRRVVGVAKRSGLNVQWMVEELSDEDLGQLFPAIKGKKAEICMTAAWEQWIGGTSAFALWKTYIRAHRGKPVFRYVDFRRRFEQWKAQNQPWKSASG